MSRIMLLSKIFPEGIPTLWCPVITPFSAPGVCDMERMHRHLEKIAPDVKGILIPGSTGEGWDMSDQDILQVMEGVLPKAKELEQHLLIGALKGDAEKTLASIDSSLQWLKELSRVKHDQEALDAWGIAGFTVCPPTGADLSQETITEELEKILRRNVPIALYQLPQVTKNSMSPETVEYLIHKYQNIIMFKDTSGTDETAQSIRDPDDVFFVRGAEGNYSTWQKLGGGPYDGFLLSTANSFSRELGMIMEYLEEGKQEEADDLSRRISACVEAVFPLAAGFEAGNAFANANKAFDHIRAWGADAELLRGPMLYGGARLDAELTAAARKVMEEQGFDVNRGYMEE